MKSVAVVGAGNIGSHLIPLVARIPAVGRMLVIDRDFYEETNRSGQAIASRDVGRAKANVQAAVIRKISPSVEAQAVVGAIESVPLGSLRVDLILACLDSPRGRQTINEAAFRLGVPWIDSGVQADGLFARIQTYVPGADSPCLECAWGDDDYRNIEQAYPCEEGRTGAQLPSHPTNAPAALGSLAAALQAIEAEKLLAGSPFVVPGRRIQIDAVHHTHLVTSFRRNRACRLGDHSPWILTDIPSPPSQVSFRRLAERVTAGCAPGHAMDATSDTATDRSTDRTPDGATQPPNDDVAFAVERRDFGLAVTCVSCGRRRPVLRLEERAPARAGACRRCGGQTLIAGFDRWDRVAGATLTAAQLDAPLDRFGVRTGDIVRLELGSTRTRFVIRGDRR